MLSISKTTRKRLENETEKKPPKSREEAEKNYRRTRDQVPQGGAVSTNYPAPLARVKKAQWAFDSVAENKGQGAGKTSGAQAPRPLKKVVKSKFICIIQRKAVSLPTKGEDNYGNNP